MQTVLQWWGQGRLQQRLPLSSNTAAAGLQARQQRLYQVQQRRLQQRQQNTVRAVLTPTGAL